MRRFSTRLDERNLALLRNKPCNLGEFPEDLVEQGNSTEQKLKWSFWLVLSNFLEI